MLADSRVEETVGDIDQQIEDDNERCVENDNTKHQRVITIQCAAHKEFAKTRNAEYFFSAKNIRVYIRTVEELIILFNKRELDFVKILFTFYINNIFIIAT